MIVTNIDTILRKYGIRPDSEDALVMKKTIGTFPADRPEMLRSFLEHMSERIENDKVRRPRFAAVKK